MSKQDKCCKTCKWFDVPLDKAGRRVVRDRAYKCVVPIPPTMLDGLPDSMVRSYWLRETVRQVREARFEPSHMTRDQGTDCPTWENVDAQATP